MVKSKMPNQLFNPTHYGLIFTAEQVSASQKRREDAALARAWNVLENPNLDSAPSLYWQAMRHRIYGDMDAGLSAIHQMNHQLKGDVGNDWEQLRDTLFMAQCFELLRDHPALVDVAPQWLAIFSDRIVSHNQMSHGMASIERFWLCAVNLAAGVVMEDAVVFETGLATFKELVAHQIHPDGYIKFAAERKDASAYFGHVVGTAALALAAEIATIAGVDLWAFNHRGVSVVTAATYVLYYYYFPDKWLWHQGLTQDETRRIFREYGAFIEIVNYRAPLRGVEILLDELRPLCDYGGGLTTLTHARPQKRRLL